MTTFISNSTFGRHLLRTVYETAGQYFTIQLLNVPPGATGDRTTWTWAANWRQYAIPGAYSSGADALNMLSTGVGDGVVGLWEEATSPAPGAYYDDRTSGTPYMGYTNNALNGLEFSHIAVFTMQGNSPVTDPTTLPDTNLSFIYAYAVTGEDPGTLASGSRFYNFLSPGYISFSSYQNFAGAVAAQEAIILDLLSGTNQYTFPFISGSTVFKSGETFQTEKVYYFNKATDIYITTVHRAALEISPTRPVVTFLAEALNVTGATPDFEDGWTGWSPYRINRYAFATAEDHYTYEEKQDSFVIDLGLYLPEYAGQFYEEVWTGIEVALQTPCEFVFTAPAAGSYTFTHIAVFINEGSAAPTQGSSYTYSNTDRLVGVIALPSSVTMTTSSAARAYPFNFGVMYAPSHTSQIY